MNTLITELFQAFISPLTVMTIVPRKDNLNNQADFFLTATSSVNSTSKLTKENGIPEAPDLIVSLVALTSLKNQ